MLFYSEKGIAKLVPEVVCEVVPEVVWSWLFAKLVTDFSINCTCRLMKLQRRSNSVKRNLYIIGMFEQAKRL